MAKILNPKQKSGSVGPSTFLSSRYGPIERVRVVPLNPKTLALMHGSSFSGDGQGQLAGLAAWCETRLATAA